MRPDYIDPRREFHAFRLNPEGFYLFIYSISFFPICEQLVDALKPSFVDFTVYTVIKTSGSDQII